MKDKKKDLQTKFTSSLHSINVPTNGNELLETVLKSINNNKEIQTLWKVININAMSRLHMTDHGPVHFQIVANGALRIMRIMNKHGIKMSVEKDFQLDFKYAEVIVFLASFLHDIGMSVNREGHEEFSLFITNALLKELLSFLPVETKTVVISEVLHAIINHRSGGHPSTIEGGIVRVADALDMTSGRSRITYDEGEINIHSVSAKSINNVEILDGDKPPVLIEVVMNHTAGVFQIDDLFKNKVYGSGIEKYLGITVYLLKNNKKVLFKKFI